jgi:PAS domain-containing protein
MNDGNPFPGAETLSRTVTGRLLLARGSSGSPLGTPEGWPQAFRALLAMVLECRAPMFLAWGNDLSFLPNDAAADLLGQRARAGIGEPLRTSFADVWSDVGPLAERTLAGGSCAMADVPLDLARRGAADASWWNLSLSPARSDDGAIAGLICLVNETTATVLKKRDREDATNRLRSALAAGDEIGSWDWDVVNDSVTSDSRFALFYSVDPDLAALGAPLEEYLKRIHPEDRESVRLQIEAAIRTGETLYAEYRLLGLNGQIQWISAQGEPVFDSQGRCVRLPGISFDITVNKMRQLGARQSGRREVARRA